MNKDSDNSSSREDLPLGQEESEKLGNESGKPGNKSHPANNPSEGTPLPDSEREEVVPGKGKEELEEEGAEEIDEVPDTNDLKSLGIKLHVPEEKKEKEPVDEEPDTGEEEEEKFLSPEEMAKLSYGDKIEEKMDTEEEEEKFLSPEEMLEISMGDKLKKKPEQEKEEEEESEEDRMFKTPDEMLQRTIGKELKKEAEKKAEEEIKEEKALPEPEKGEDGEEAPEKVAQLTPGDLSEEEIAPEVLKQLDMGPILKKKDIDSPIEMLAPEEIEVEEEFVSKALEPNTVLQGRYKIIKLLSEKRDRASYIVKDIKETNKKYVLREIRPQEMSKEELRKRRNKFQDIVRIINTFRHPNLAEVYSSFSEMNREFCLMENVEGLSLKKLAQMNTKPFSEKEVFNWALNLCDALEFMHYRPQPFTLGDLQPRHIMVDTEGVLNIINYDLQRFFDINRTLEFMPDDPTKLYSDITKLSRVLFFLLTKKYWDETVFEIEWPDSVGKKMRKLLETACAEGQRTFGDIKQFREKLKETQIEEEEEVDYLRKKYDFPLTKLDFSWFYRGVNAVLSQNPLLLALEVIFLVFILFYFTWVNPPGGLKYRRPADPVAYVFAGDTLEVFRTSNFEKVFSVDYEGKMSLIHPETLKIQLKDEEEKTERKVVMIGFEGSDSIKILDSENLQELKNIKTETGPSRVAADDEGKYFYVLCRSAGMVAVVDREKLQTVDIYLAGDNPTDILFIPLDEEGKKKRERMMEKRKEGEKTRDKDNAVESAPTSQKAEKPQPPDIPAPTIAVSTTSSKDIVFLNADNGNIVKRLYVSGIPKALALSGDNNTLYVLDSAKGEVRIVDVSDRDNIKYREDQAPISLDGEKFTDMVIDPVENQLIISSKISGSLSMVNLATRKIKESENVGIEPSRLYMDPANRKIWVLNGGSKDIAVVESSTGKVVEKIEIGKKPTEIGIEVLEIKAPAPPEKEYVSPTPEAIKPFPRETEAEISAEGETMEVDEPR